MTEAASHELIIVRRHEEEEHAHHSSAWKVAHADFMTAMMAFFLIMWLINVTDDQMRKGIAQFFNPIHMSQGSSEMKGLNKVDSKDQGEKGHGQQAPDANKVLNLIDLTAGHADPAPAKAVNPEAAAAALNAAAELAAKLAEAGGVDATKEKGGGSAVDALKTISAAAVALQPANGGADRAAFADPYAVLAKLEQQYVNTRPTTVDAITGDARAQGTPGGEIDRDPFDPSYWQMVPLPTARTDQAGAPGSNEEAPGTGRPDATAPTPGALPLDVLAPDGAPGVAAEKPVANVAPAVAPDAPKPDAAKADVAKADAPNADGAKAEVAKADGGEKTVAAATLARSSEIAKDIEAVVAPMMSGQASPDLAIKATPEGVTISLTDDADYAMFGVGSAVPDPKTVVLMEHIAKVLATQPGAIVIRGHTDGRPFHSADYDNWRLSTARAQMAYYTLMRGGLPEARVTAIEGYADRALKNAADPYAAENRRIEILVKAP